MIKMDDVEQEKSKLIEILLIVGSILFAFNSAQNFSPMEPIMNNIMILFLIFSIFYWILLHKPVKTTSIKTLRILLCFFLSACFAMVVGTSIGVNIALNPSNPRIFATFMAILYYTAVTFGLFVFFKE